jgi:hypothetical protein
MARTTLLVGMSTTVSGLMKNYAHATISHKLIRGDSVTTWHLTFLAGMCCCIYSDYTQFTISSFCLRNKYLQTGRLN